MSITLDLALEYLYFDRKSFSLFLETSPVEDVIKFLENLSHKDLTQIFPLFSHSLLSLVLSDFPNKKIAGLLESSPPGLKNRIFYFTPKEKREILLSLLSAKESESLLAWKPYLNKTAGYYMDCSVFPLSDDLSAKSCLEKLQNKNSLSQYIYFVDKEAKLTGVSTIKRILEESMEQGKNLCKSFMSSPVLYIHFDNNIKEIVNHKSWSKYHSIPVVDYDESFLGVLDYSIFNRIKREAFGEEPDHHLETTSHDLSELYTLGLKSVFQSISSPSKEKGE